MKVFFISSNSSGRTGFIRPLLRGIGQVMLQENAVAGLFFLMAMFLISFKVGMSVLVGAFIGTAISKMLNWDRNNIKSGLYGFNAALIALALDFFFQPGSFFISVVIGATLATFITHGFILLRIPVFTFPFIVVGWLFLLLSGLLPDWLVLNHHEPFKDGNNASLLTFSLSQVFFQAGIWSGLFILIGLFLSKPIAGFSALYAIFLSAFIAFLLKEAPDDIYYGLFGYNAVLCALVFTEAKFKSFIYTSLSVVLSVFIYLLMRKFNLPALTFPFVLATWIVLSVKWLFNKKEKSTAVSH